MNQGTEFKANKLSELVGGTIKAVALDKSMSEDFLGLQITLPDGRERVLWIMADDEANGPGSFSINSI